MQVDPLFRISLVFLVLCGGCQSGNKPLPVPGVEVEWAAYAGTVVGSPTTRKVDLAQGWLVHTTLVGLSTDPGQLLEPLSSRGRLFAQPALGDPVLANPQLTRDIRIGTDSKARDWFDSLTQTKEGQTIHAPPITIAESGAVLAEGVTITLKAAKGNQWAEVRLNRRADQKLDLLVAMQGMIAPTVETTPPTPAKPGRESVLLDPIPLNVNEPIIVIIPQKEGEVRAMVARFDLSLQSADESAVESFAAASKRTGEMLGQSAKSLAAIPTMLPTKNDAWSGYEFALRRTDEPALRRGSLNYVAAQTGSLIAHDLIVVADDKTLGDFTALLLRSMAASNLPHEPMLLGWLMDRTALELCAARVAEGPLPAEMASVLTIHAGEAGRNPASLGDLIKGVASREDLLTRLTVENMIYLEDSSPASRVRAFDFLAARGLAPAGFDPLGPLPQRREALEKASNPTTAPAAPGVQP